MWALKNVNSMNGWEIQINMPRKKVKRDPQAVREKEKVLEAAITAVEGGQSMRSAAKEFGIPYSTLQDHHSGKTLTHKIKHCTTPLFMHI